MDLPHDGSHGAYLRSELLDHMGRHALATALRAHELTPLWRGVVVDTRRSLDPWARAAAALMTTGPEAVVCGPTAAILHGCTSVTSPDAHVLLPYWRQSRRRPGLVVHRGSFFADEITELDGLRLLTLARTAADLLCRATSSDALAMADEVLRLSGEHYELTRRQIAAQIRRRPDPRGSVRGARLLDLASPRADSAPESWLRMMVIERGFPPPEVNWPLLGIDGHEVYRLDLAWPTLRIVVEYDGYEAHVDRADADRQREADLRGRGWIVIRASKKDLSNLRRVENALREAFTRRGYDWGATVVPDRRLRRKSA